MTPVLGALAIVGAGFNGASFLNYWHATGTPSARCMAVLRQITIATGAGGQYLFRDFTERGAVASLYDFENRRQLFPAVESRQKFCLLSLAGKAVREPAARFAFFLLDAPDLDDPGRVFALSPAEITLLNPNTGTLPIFRSRRDADVTAAIYRRIPVLWDETKPEGNPWGITVKNLFNMTDDSDLFRTRAELEAVGWHLEGNTFTRAGKSMLPLYEAKMADFFNHRAADVVKSETAVNRQNQPGYLTVKELQDRARSAIPLYWITDEGLIPTRRNGRDVKVPGVVERLAELEWEQGWLLNGQIAPAAMRCGHVTRMRCPRLNHSRRREKPPPVGRIGYRAKAEPGSVGQTSPATLRSRHLGWLAALRMRAGA